jgi:tetratricopeptide (TPR) repeat protein
MVLRFFSRKKAPRPRREAVSPEAPVSSAPAAVPTVEERLARARANKLRYDVAGYSKGVDILTGILGDNPFHGPAHAMLAECYAYWGFRREIQDLESESYYERAMTHAQAAVHLVPTLAAAHRAMSVALRRGAGAQADARRESALTALDLDSGDGENWYEYWRAFGYSTSDHSIERAIELEPENLGAWIDYGVVLCRSGRLEEAERYLRKALKLSPGHPLAAANLATVLHRRGDDPAAQKVLAAALSENPEEPLLKDAALSILWSDQTVDPMPENSGPKDL